jgi:HD-GYP domain-containing protein (c-di-GMP phosphodiesterase class II)
MGSALGLPRPTLANLGVAGLLHDVGKLAVSPEVLHKPGRLDPGEWEQMRRHPFEGVKLATRLPGLTRLTLDVMRVTLEHHRHVDGGGYPVVEGARPMLALSRIVAVADCYDAMTAHRSYRARPFTGREALELLAGAEGHHHEPAALWALIRTVGVYPAGTVMRTRSGHVVLSVSPGADPHFPRCRVLCWPDDRIVDETTPVFWEPMPADESVIEVLAPEQYPMPIEPLHAA